MRPVTVTRSGAVATITINRPHRRNALDRPAALALLSAVERSECAPDIRAVILTGAGTAFCAGDDITTLDGDRPTLPDGRMIYLRVAELILTMPKPVIAAVNGPAVGAGTELACAADLRLAAESAHLGSGLLHVGQVGNVALLGRVVGPARATEIYLTGRLVPAPEALHIGLIDRLVPDPDLPQAAAELAATLATGPTRTIALYKELRQLCTAHPLDALAHQDTFHTRAMAETTDAHEGLRAYLQHRTPLFTGT